LPRDLEDVLHYFLPVAERSEDFAREREAVSAPVALPILTVPVASRDVCARVRMNLTVELARLGARS